jgi:hypothetical protein
MKWVWDELNKQFQNSSTISVDRKSNGYSWNVINPLPGGGSSPAGVRVLTFNYSLGDYFTTTENVNVAKPYKLRCSIASELIYGTPVSYSYPHNPSGGRGTDPLGLAYLYRVATINGLFVENEGVCPQYIQGDKILAIEVPGGTGVGTDVADYGSVVPVTWQQISTAQAWTRFADQTFGT